jgi:CRP-like cAMP-binding protein
MERTAMTQTPPVPETSDPSDGMPAFLAGVDPARVAGIRAAAKTRTLGPGEYLFREGDPADRFYQVRSGRVDLEVHAPTGRLLVETVGGGDLVGWSWMIEPFRWFLDARVPVETTVTAYDAAALREACEADPVLGYALLRQVTAVMYARLQAARVRLLDLYGGTRAGAG